jgi:uncharacterized FAD-dependent dehydrogenase
MQRTISISLRPGEAADERLVIQEIASALSVKPEEVSGYTVLKRSVDARSRQPLIRLSLLAYVDEPALPRSLVTFEFKDVHAAKKSVVIIGAGPAGLFAALQLIELGIKPIILERGLDVKSRRRDLAAINKQGVVNPESNYCFGEGGAGTYSDGKLYTRSHKRGDVERILQLFHFFGAEEKMLYESHPHIGTNKLPKIITAMREQILASGGEVHFNRKVVDLIGDNDRIKGVKTADGTTFEADAFILATGHSARDIYYLLHAKGILLESKPFALGVRAEHPQELIDKAQYRCDVRDPFLPPASYSLVEQVGGLGVFSFCMCPGGIIAPAATSPGEIVVNGWSPSKRNNPYANSGIVVQVGEEDVRSTGDFNLISGRNVPGALFMLDFQQWVEQRAFKEGGGGLVAPAQRMVDFCNNKVSSSLPGCSYLPGIRSSDLREVLPGFIHQALQKAFVAFGKKMRGYYSNEAVLVATESRTSSPVRIPRGAETRSHPAFRNLYPCGEGAGYAGGIVSAAMDGEKTAKTIAALWT